MLKLSLVQVSEAESPQDGVRPSLKWESWVRPGGAADAARHPRSPNARDRGHPQFA